jgi:hypothetical protein
MPEKDKNNYEILKEKTPISPAVSVRVVNGRSSAELTVNRLNRNLTEEEKKGGLCYFLEETTKKASSGKKSLGERKGRLGRKNGRPTGR